MADSDSDWRRWGETDPYYAVLSHSRFRLASIQDSRDEFFELGRLTVEERLAAAERHFGPVEHRRALDFGCGVGRLSIPLAVHFDEVLGLDVAPAMLAEARVNADARGISNLRLDLSDDDLSRAEGAFDLVICFIVLQHIPVRRGMRIISRLLDRVAPGGVAAIQLCIARPATPGAGLRYWAQCHIPGLHGLFNISRGRPWSEPLMQMNAYPLDDVLVLAQAAGFAAPVVEPYSDGRFEAAQLLMRRH
jgi:SAM-dependent methyltransferase